MGILLFVAFSSSWGSCRPWYGTFASSGSNIDYCRKVLSSYPKIACSNMVGGYFRCSSSWCGSTGGVTIDALTGTCNQCYGRQEGQSYYVGSNQYNPACSWLNCQQCDTQAEADSLKCVLNPGSPGCQLPMRDTTFTWCKEGLKLMSSGQYEWYVSVLNCRGQYDPNVNEIYFNEKENCGSGMEVPGSCNDHGLKTGFNQSGEDGGNDVKCFAYGEDGTVWLQGPTGEAYPCPADGSCEIAKQKVMKGECTDGVDRSGSSSSGDAGSSSSSAGGSSSSEGGDSGSSGSTGGSSGSSVDYSPVLAHMDKDLHEQTAYLQSMNKYTQWNYNANHQIAQNTQNLLSGLGEVNSSLVQINNSLNVEYTPEVDNNDYTVDTTTSPIIDPQDQERNDSIMASVVRERSMVDSIRRDFDSTMKHIDSIRADTNNNYMALDSMYNWKDTAIVKEKLGKIFLPTTTTNTCFVCDKTIELFNWRYRLYINFGSFMGFDLCSFVRAIVRFVTAIIVTFTTIKSFIRAFSSGGGNT